MLIIDDQLFDLIHSVDSLKLARELDLFRDDAFFAQIEQLHADAATLELSPQFFRTLPLQDIAWAHEVELTSELLKALETGADQLILPTETFPTHTVDDDAGLHLIAFHRFTVPSQLTVLGIECPDFARHGWHRCGDRHRSECDALTLAAPGARARR